MRPPLRMNPKKLNCGSRFEGNNQCAEIPMTTFIRCELLINSAEIDFDVWRVSYHKILTDNSDSNVVQVVVYAHFRLREFVVCAKVHIGRIIETPFDEITRLYAQ